MRKKLMKYLGIKNNRGCYPPLGELILIKSILLSMNKSGKAPFHKINSCFYDLHSQLCYLTDGKSISKTELYFIKSASCRAIVRAGFVELKRDGSGLVLTKKLLKKLSKHNIKVLHEFINDKLNGSTLGKSAVMPDGIIGQIDSLFGAVELWEHGLSEEQDKAINEQMCVRLQKTQKWKELIKSLKIEVIDALRERAQVECVSTRGSIVGTTNIDNSCQVFSVTIRGERFAVDSWGALLVKVCEGALINRPYLIADFDRHELLNRECQMFSYIQAEIAKRPKQLDNGLYVETDNSGVATLKTCRMIMELCGYDADDLVIEY